MADMEWVDLAEVLIDKGEWSKDLQRRFVAAMRLVENILSQGTNRHPLDVKLDLLARLRSGEVEEQS